MGIRALILTVPPSLDSLSALPPDSEASILYSQLAVSQFFNVSSHQASITLHSFPSNLGHIVTVNFGDLTLKITLTQIQQTSR